MSAVRAMPLAICLAGLLAGCARQDDDAVAGAMARTLASTAPRGTPATVWADAKRFYQLRANAPAWVDRDKVSTRASDAIAAIRSAQSHGLDASRYGHAALEEASAALAELRKKDTPDLPERLAAFDVQVSTALLTLGREIAIGRTSPAVLDRRWKQRRDAPDLAATLAQVVQADVTGWLGAIAPQHPEYAALQRGLATLHAQQEQGGWPAVPVAAFSPGKSHPAVAMLRQRLAASGDLDSTLANGSSVYDDHVRDAVRRLQDRHGLKADGIAGRPTISAMNVPIGRRIQQVEMNLDRWRWMPDDFGSPHLLVNIPAYHLFIREGGATTTDIRVVVGKPGNETPVFSEQMETVVFSPYWNIPDTIVEGETAPAIMRDPDYIRRNNLEILRPARSGTRRVEPGDVDWEDPEELRQLAFRQRPGPNNALGHVKFLFPNPHNVYLHDTPADTLFSRPGRAFSHGCVRVEEPQALAEYVLRDQPAWTSDRIVQAMLSGDEQHVRLATPLPVHIVYFTAWPDERGNIRLFADIYGHDGRQAAALAKR